MKRENKLSETERRASQQSKLMKSFSGQQNQKLEEDEMLLQMDYAGHKQKNSFKEKLMLPRDWRQALRTPHVYRVGNSTFRIQSHFLVFIILLFIVIISLYTYPVINKSLTASTKWDDTNCRCSRDYSYNNKYPLTEPLRSSISVTFNISIVTDLDTESKSDKEKNTWCSYLRKGHLTWMPSNNFISVTWDDYSTMLTSSFSMKGRGMELSELVVFDGKLLTFDDRSGIVFVVQNNSVYPWVILLDGDGKNSKGFKSEWATVKDEQLYVGGMGKEWTTTDGEFRNYNPQWIKVISPRGEVNSLNWVANYKKLRRSIGIEFPGYMIHESGTWSDIHKKWFFLPRRCSKEQYHEAKDETMSCNILLTADEDFLNIQVVEIGDINPTRGFSSFKFLPESKDTIIIALKSEEYLGKTATYITAFTIEGNILMPDIKIEDKKFEGLEFV